MRTWGAGACASVLTGCTRLPAHEETGMLWAVGVVAVLAVAWFLITHWPRAATEDTLTRSDLAWIDKQVRDVQRHSASHSTRLDHHADQLKRAHRRLDSVQRTQGTESRLEVITDGHKALTSRVRSIEELLGLTGEERMAAMLGEHLHGITRTLSDLEERVARHDEFMEQQRRWLQSEAAMRAQRAAADER